MNTRVGKRKLARKVMAWCFEHHIHYENISTYPTILNPATKYDLRTSNGMLYHIPYSHWKDPPPQGRAYLLWHRETLPQIIEGMAFLKMLGNHELVLVNCKRRNE